MSAGVPASTKVHDLAVFAGACALSASYLSLLLPLLDRGLADHLGEQVYAVAWEPEETWPWLPATALAPLVCAWLVTMVLGAPLAIAGLVLSGVALTRTWARARTVAVVPLASAVALLGCLILAFSPWGQAMTAWLLD